MHTETLASIERASILGNSLLNKSLDSCNLSTDQWCDRDSYRTNFHSDGSNCVTAFVKQRLKDAYPEADEFVMVLSSADEKALPDACVVEAAKDALAC